MNFIHLSPFLEANWGFHNNFQKYNFFLKFQAWIPKVEQDYQKNMIILIYRFQVRIENKVYRSAHVVLHENSKKREKKILHENL